METSLSSVPRIYVSLVRVFTVFYDDVFCRGVFCPSVRTTIDVTPRTYTCTYFSLLGEKREGVVFSRPLRALRAA